MEKIGESHAILRNDIERSSVPFTKFSLMVTSCKTMFFLLVFRWNRGSIGKQMLLGHSVLVLLLGTNGFSWSFFWSVRVGTSRLAVCAVPCLGGMEHWRNIGDTLLCFAQVLRPLGSLPPSFYLAKFSYACFLCNAVVRKRIRRNGVIAYWWTRICF